MSEGLILPVGADLTGLHQAFSTISASAARMGQKINSSIGANQTAFNKLASSTTSAGGAFHGLFSRIGSGGATAFSGLTSASKAAFASISSSMALLGVGGGLGGLGAGIALTMKSVSSAANIEGLETSFAPLLGGADKAQARIKELAQFAADTPFEMPEVAKASRVLEVLTKGALSTGQGLRMVGDVAATTQQPFEELALHIGRLYDGLQSGRPVGEALARLQELGVISGDVRSRIEELQKSGAAGNEVWQVAAGALGRFSGAMDAQSRTWNGKLSTFKDNVSMAMAEFGKPIMDALKPYLNSASNMAGRLGKSAAAFGQRIAESIKFISAAFSSGQVGALLGSSIKLGFIDATNFLWRSLNGIFAASGQYMIENFRTAVEMVNILTKADFWKGMGNAIIGVFLDAIAFFQKGLAAALEAVRPLAEMIGQGDKVSSAKKTLNDSAGILREEASSYYNKASGQLAPMINQVTERLKTAWANIGERFAAAYANAGDLIDPNAAAAEVRTIMDLIKEMMKITQTELDTANAKMKAETAGGEDEKKSPLQKVGAAMQPTVMSLTRIGGGGFSAAVMSGMAAPLRSIAADMKQVVKNTKPDKNPPKPVWMGVLS